LTPSLLACYEASALQAVGMADGLRQVQDPAALRLGREASTPYLVHVWKSQHRPPA